QSKIEDNNVWAVSDLGSFQFTFKIFLMQKGKDIYDAEGNLAFEKSDMIEYLEIWERLRAAGAAPPAAVTAEEQDVPELRLISSGQVAMHMQNANQLVGMQRVNDETLELISVPSGNNGAMTQDFNGTFIS